MPQAMVLSNSPFVNFSPPTSWMVAKVFAMHTSNNWVMGKSFKNILMQLVAMRLNFKKSEFGQVKVVMACWLLPFHPHLWPGYRFSMIGAMPWGLFSGEGSLYRSTYRPWFWMQAMSAAWLPIQWQISSFIFHVHIQGLLGNNLLPPIHCCF